MFLFDLIVRSFISFRRNTQIFFVLQSLINRKLNMNIPLECFLEICKSSSLKKEPQTKHAGCLPTDINVLMIFLSAVMYIFPQLLAVSTVFFPYRSMYCVCYEDLYGKKQLRPKISVNITNSLIFARIQGQMTRTDQTKTSQ